MALTGQQQNAVNYLNKVGNSISAEQYNTLASAIYGSGGVSNSPASIASQASNLSYDDVINQIKTLSAENTAKSQELAEKQWQFNAEEAQKSRDWQEYMSNTSIQRFVQDAEKAGVNPILWYAGSGSSVGSGATASGSSGTVDTSANSVLGSYLNTLINSATAINQANINAKTNLAIADINQQSAIYSANMASEASKYSANTSAYSYLKGIENNNAFNEFIKQNYPNTSAELLSGILNGIAQGSGLDGVSDLYKALGSWLTEQYSSSRSKSSNFNLNGRSRAHY